MSDRLVRAGEVTLAICEHLHAGETVLFLHYGGGNLAMWQGVVPFFKNDYRLLLVDLRGHGLSDKPADGYHMDAMAEDIHHLLSALSLEKVHIVGSSLGAEVGLSLAANHPGQVLSLTCEGALFSEFGPFGLWAGDESSFQEHSQQILLKIRERSKVYYPSVEALVEANREDFLKRGWWNDRLIEVARRDAFLAPGAGYSTSWHFMGEPYYRNYLTYRLEDYYRRINCPILMLPDIYPGQNAREKEVMHQLFDLARRGKITAIPEWVHPFGWLLDPAGGSRAVLDFLGEVKEGKF
jgi:pimeloyl-ACP methyl ester carboxylesterase